MAIATGAFAALLEPDLRRVYMEVGKERPLEYPMIFNVMDMERRIVRDQQMAGLGPMQTMPEGTQFPLTDPLLGSQKAYTAEPFGLGFEISFEAWRDELYGQFRSLSGELGRASRDRQELEAMSVLNNAFNTAYPGFTSGESLCSTAHVGLDGVTRSNRPSVDIAFSVTALQAAVEHFESLTNERNQTAHMQPRMALVSYQNRWVAREILGSSQVPYRADNEINALVPDDITYMISHYLTTATNWFLLAAMSDHDLQFLWRDRPIFDAFDDPRTKGAVFTVYQRHTKGFGDWRGIYGSTGA